MLPTPQLIGESLAFTNKGHSSSTKLQLPFSTAIYRSIVNTCRHKTHVRVCPAGKIDEINPCFRTSPILSYSYQFTTRFIRAQTSTKWEPSIIDGINMLTADERPEHYRSLLPPLRSGRKEYSTFIELWKILLKFFFKTWISHTVSKKIKNSNQIKICDKPGNSPKLLSPENFY